MFFWIYDIPKGALAVLLSATCLAYTWLGLLVFRPIVRRWLGPQPGLNDLVYYFQSALVVFYGLLLGLIAVATYQSYTDADNSVVREAASLAALYRDVSDYPQPLRANLQKHLKDYTRYVIEEAWPAQQRGIVPREGTAKDTAFQRDLFSFQPRTKAEDIMHAQTVMQFNTLVEARRVRLQNVTTGLPAVLWYVIAIGTALNLALLWMFSIDRLSVQLVLSGALSVFVGLMLFFIAAMDHPLRGTVSITPAAYINVQESLMVEGSGPPPGTMGR